MFPTNFVCKTSAINFNIGEQCNSKCQMAVNIHWNALVYCSIAAGELNKKLDVIS